MLSFSHLSLCIFSQLQIYRVLYFIKAYITLCHFAVERICKAIHEKMTTFYRLSQTCAQDQSQTNQEFNLIQVKEVKLKKL